MCDQDTAMASIGGPEAVPEVVDFLRDLLSRAEAGEIIGVAAGFACHGRDTASGFVLGEATIADLYLGVGRVRLRLLEH